MKNLILVLALMSSMTAVAGHEVGNGGTIIKCDDGRRELTDLFEARVFRGLKSALGDRTEDFRLKIERVFADMARVAPYRAQKYRQLYASFFQEAIFTTGVDLTPISDVDPKGLPAGCYLKQTVLQTVPQFVGDMRYTIDQDIWNELDENSKAGLVIHEIIYNEALFNNEQKSTTTRYLTGVVTSTLMQGLTQDQFNEMLLSARFNTIDKYNSLITIDKNCCNDELTIYSGKNSSFYSSVQLPEVTELLGVKFRSYFNINSNTFSQKYQGGILEIVRPNLKINYVEGNMDQSAISYTVDGDGSKLSFNSTLAKLKYVIKAGDAEMTLKNWLIFPDGTETTIAFDSDAKPKYWVGSLQVNIPKLNYSSPLVRSGDSRGLLYPSGIIERGFLTEPSVKLNSPQGELFFTSSGGATFNGSDMTYFDEHGLVKRSYVVAGQSVKTVKGIEVTKVGDLITFLENGLAELAGPPPAIQ